MICRAFQLLVFGAIALAWAGEQLQLRADCPLDSQQCCWSEVGDEAEKDELQADSCLAGSTVAVPEVHFYYVRFDRTSLELAIGHSSPLSLRGPPRA